MRKTKFADGRIFLILYLQTSAKAVEFYDDKVKGLDANLLELEKIVQGKNTQLRGVEEGSFLFMPLCLLAVPANILFI